ncbi:MAG: hypothetical protein CVU78_07715 [Elusimicrobia bacterium HGW-Elusimicrobia-2]|nr:MAG: hypothetical protein CVU78_07715 [Elusimicrobia bacterium HGW-Elusimicrobia-2]
MTNSFRRSGVLHIALAFFIAQQGFLRAAEPSAAARAEALYKQGNFAEAVATAEDEYARTGDSELKLSLINYLTELGLDMSFKENYSAAAYAFSRALALAPDDVTLKELADTTKDLSPSSDAYGETPKTTPAETKPAPTQPSINNVYLKQQRALMLKLEKLTDAIGKNYPATGNTNRFQQNAISANTEKKLDKLIATSENAAVSINKAVSETGTNIKRTFIATVAASAAAIAALIASAFLIARYAVNRHHMLNFSIKNSAAEIGPRKNAKRIPIINPLSGGLSVADSTKYEGIDIIEAELSSENSTEASVAKKLLEPFLNDSDIELKIRAIKALYKYSEDEACLLLEQEAFKSGDGIKIFCRLIQLPKPEKSAEIAGELMKKIKPSEKNLLANALLKINTPDLDEKLRDKINSLAGISKSGDCIVG